MAAAAGAAPAQARITEYPLDPTGTPVARAMAQNPTIVRRAVFPALPPNSKPVALSTTPLAGFPRHGSSYGILTTGNARYADDRNREPDRGAESGGPSVRGARDVVIMRIDLRVPRGANCLSFSFRFLSEEFPEFVHDIFNDAFIAEMDISNWDASSKSDPTITAPRNFARNAAGRPIRVNSVGTGRVSASAASGTTYDGATRILRARTRVKPGLHRLYLSIFDQGDRIYDSAVFIDRLVVERRSSCKTGTVVDK
ncbi:MAG: choice-of-anchor L domain-containing protein [Actinomycetota bacterium]|nr:choice-of-anchor L domain-containing protein [Actinomycetota bacterium]